MDLQPFVGARATFTTSSKAKDLLVVGNYEYRYARERTTDSTTVYRCRKNTCKATAELVDGSITALKGTHTCNPPDNAANLRNVNNRLNALASQSSRGQSRRVVAESLEVIFLIC